VACTLRHKCVQMQRSGARSRLLSRRRLAAVVALVIVVGVSALSRRFFRVNVRDAPATPNATRALSAVPTDVEHEEAERPASAEAAPERSANAIVDSPAELTLAQARAHQRERDIDVPWRHPGMCANKPGAAFARARNDYLSSFAPVAAWHTTLYVHPDVPDWAAGAIADSLERTVARVTSKLGLASDPPRIYLYPTVEALRKHSCTSSTAVAYYDGAIHLSTEKASERMRSALSADDRDKPMRIRRALAEMQPSLTHEYVHHALVSNAIVTPMWFQEGAAMTIAGDPPRGYWTLWQKNPVDLRRMVNTFPRQADLPTVTIFNAQAFAMTEFLDSLCWARKTCNLSELAEALVSGQATPETLFEWAIAQRGSDLRHTTRLPLWDDYTERGKLGPETHAALNARR
jgi:hypothetical protein